MSRIELIGEVNGCVCEQAEEALRRSAVLLKKERAEMPVLKLAKRVRRWDGEREVWELGRLEHNSDYKKPTIFVATEDAMEYWENGATPETGVVFAVAHLALMWGLTDKKVNKSERNRYRKAGRMALSVVRSMYSQEKRRLKYPNWWEDLADRVEEVAERCNFFMGFGTM